MAVKKYVIRINGSKWHYAVLPEKEYDKKYDPNGDAETLTTQKLIVFKEEEFCLTTVIHELIHAYYTILCLADTQNISINDVEEIAATFTETHILSILQNAIKIYTKYKEDVKGALKELDDVIKKIKNMNYNL